MTKILVIDDEPQIQKFLRISLTSQQMEVISAETGHLGLNAAVEQLPDLIVLDLGLPDMDGKYVLQHLVAETQIPVLVLSVRASETEKVACLEMGAYDYIVKPFSVKELLARIKRTLAITSSKQEDESLEFDNGNLVVDVTRHKVFLNSEPVVLTRKEWAVFLHLVQSGGALVSQTTLLQKIWGNTHLEDTHYLRNVIQKLRQKMNDDAAHPRFIETEPGVGYRFIPGR